MNSVFSDNLRRLRQAKGYTQEQVAARLSVAPQSVSRWETGATAPDIMLLPTLAELYCVTVDDLFRPEADAYVNYARRLLSVYESTRSREDFIRAANEFDRLFEQGGNTTEDLRSYGVLHEIAMMACGDKALMAYNQVLERGPEGDGTIYRRTRLQRIHLLSHLGGNDMNISRQKKALAEHPDDPWEHVLTLAALCYAQRYEEAETLFVGAVKRFPRQAELYVYGGDACHRLGKVEEAIAWMKKGLEIDPDLMDVRYALGDIYLEQKAWDKALTVWEELARCLEDKGWTIEAEEPKKHAKLCRDMLKK